MLPCVTEGSTVRLVIEL